MKKYNISEKCIGCRACVEVASNNFVMNDTNKAWIKKQPESDNEALQ
ncbi:MAG: ferredoxin, partial [Candidatus Marinimicrobia bacterium]|nr:ferredoxin [Candidatus Neomarinimicrobiota bacterium]